MQKIMKARKGGFTLVELLIVIMIIAILAGMMMLATGSATDSAEVSKIVNDMRAVKAAMMMYYADNNEWIPAGKDFMTDAAAETSLSRYMDRSLDKTKYTGIKLEETTDGNKMYAVFTIPALTNSKSLRNKFEKNAESAGLFESTGKAPYKESNGNQVSVYVK